MSKIDKLVARAKYLFLFLFAIIILYGILGELFLPSEKHSYENYCEIYQQKFFQLMPSGKWISVDIPNVLQSENDKDIVLETYLPNQIREDAYLVLRTSKQDVQVYVQGQFRQEYSTQNSRLWGKTSPTYYMFVKLSSEDAGKLMQIHYQSIPRYAGVVREIYYANYGGFWTHMILEEGQVLIVAVIMVMMAALALAVSVVIRIIYKQEQKLTSLSLGILVVAFWMLGNSMFRQMIFPNVSVVGDLTFLMVTALPFPFAAYIDLLQNMRYRKAYFAVEIAALLDIIGCSALYITGSVDFAESFYVMAMVLLALVLIIVVTMIKDAIGGFIKEYLVTAIAILIAAVVMIIQVVIYLQTDKPFDITIAAVGLMIMLFVAAYDAVRDMYAFQEEKHTAIQASETKSQFLANMSHEIRTPINAILGMNTMILKESNEEQILSYAHDVENSGKMLLSLINDILDFSKIESGKMELVESEYDFRDVLSQLVNLVKQRAQSKGLGLKFDINEQLPYMLYGDAAKLQQIVTNLLTNAVKYTDEGSITLEIDFQPMDDTELLLMVTVKDTGRGIKEEDVDKLFDSFQRVDQKKNQSIEGTGLGLAITKRLTEMMQGQIEVHSTYGQGTSFCIAIPQKITAKYIIGKYDINTLTKRTEQIKTENLTLDARVLVVDDVKMNLKVFAGFLKGTGVEIVTAMSGQEAIEAWKQQHFDIVFLDHMMPVMDGIECGRILRSEREFNPDTPIIMLTANAISGMREEYLAEGFSDYMTKPFTIEQLRDMLKKYLPADKWSVNN